MQNERIYDYFEMQNHMRFCKNQDYQEILNSSVQSWWVPELPALLPDSPSGFMWVAVPCLDTDMDFLIPAEEGAVEDVCEVKQFLVPEILDELESGVFVEPLPDQIAIVYEYQQVQVCSFKQVIIEKTRDFCLNPQEFSYIVCQRRNCE